MKKLSLITCFLLLTLLSYAQKSPRKVVSDTISNVAITIDYGAPSVKGRKIWGGLEKYNKVWRAGANENTTITFAKNVIIGNKPLRAGKYGFFIIPREKGKWTVIFNTKNNGWGVFSYKQKKDALRYNILPQFMDENQEVLEYSFNENNIIFKWEKVQLIIPVKVSR